MTLKLENIQFKESITPNISCKSKDSRCDDIVNFFQPEGSSMKTQHDDNVIPLKLKTSRKVYTRKGDLGKCNLLSGERVMKDADQVEAGDNVDELKSVLGVLFVYDFYKHPTPSDQAKTILDDEVSDQVEEAIISEISENTSVDAKVAQGLTVKQVLNKANNDQDFWVDLLENGSLALSEFNLSSEAKAAIASGDVQWVYDNVGDLPEREMAFLYKRLEREAW